MHKYQLLRLRTEEFRVALEKYAEIDSDVEWFLERWMPWCEKIIKRELRIPCCEYNLGIYFFSGEVKPNFLTRYVAEFKKDVGWHDLKHPLGTAASNFSVAIRDDLSDPQYITRIKASGENLEIIPDEPPPPDEEMPLAEPPKPVSKQIWLKKFIFGCK
jgi:hypothetical protein